MVIRFSLMSEVDVFESKTNNRCTLENINEDAETYDDQGNIVDYNWCFHPLYFPPEL